MASVTKSNVAKRPASQSAPSARCRIGGGSMFMMKSAWLDRLCKIGQRKWRRWRWKTNMMKDSCLLLMCYSCGTDMLLNVTRTAAVRYICVNTQKQNATVPMVKTSETGFRSLSRLNAKDMDTRISRKRTRTRKIIIQSDTTIAKQWNL